MRRVGFALPAVLGALVVTALLLAIAAQRALWAARDAALAESRAELAAATQSAAAESLSRDVDTLLLWVAPPGATLDSGQARVRLATARWRLTAVLPPLALLSVEAVAPVRRDSARTSWRLWLRRGADSSGAPRWEPAGRAWGLQVPVP